MADRSILSPLARRALVFGCMVASLDNPIPHGGAGAARWSAPDAGGAGWDRVPGTGGGRAGWRGDRPVLGGGLDPEPGRGPFRIHRIDRARASLRLDLVFLAVYPVTFLMACFWAAGVLRRAGAKGATIVRSVGWPQPVAGAADLAKNLLLFQVLDGSFQLVHAVRWAATLKFALLTLGFLSFLWGVVVREMPTTRAPVSR